MVNELKVWLMLLTNGHPVQNGLDDVDGLDVVRLGLIV